ncbi:MAG: hypothetical protein PHU31_09840 [Anaerotignum sp.]|nr:hypothetical protein [Anaerotignum sp.]
MNIRKKLLNIFIFALILVLSGCGEQKTTENTQEGTSSEIGNDEETPLLETVAENEVTPYQLLYLMCGNAQELEFHYTVTRPDSKKEEIHFFQRKGEVSVDSFITQDMNGNDVFVRELEMDGKVHYIMDNEKVIKTYLAPAEDFLLYQMIEASQTTLERSAEEEGYMLYEYRLPFIQDETIQYQYCFFMKDNLLKKLTVSLGDKNEVTYEFTEFQQEITDAAAFHYPMDYAEESYDYSYNWEYMPPWWEIGNDQ